MFDLLLFNIIPIDTDSQGSCWECWGPKQPPHNKHVLLEIRIFCSSLMLAWPDHRQKRASDVTTVIVNSHCTFSLQEH